MGLDYTAGCANFRDVGECLLSEGEVRREWIGAALEGVGDPRVYFRRVNLERCRHRVLGGSGTDG